MCVWLHGYKDRERMMSRYDSMRQQAQQVAAGGRRQAAGGYRDSSVVTEGARV
jgi:hypothetical protein